MKPQERVTMTKTKIYHAFLELVEECGLRQMTIRALCQRAGINRTTFYDHYGSQYDVLQDLTEQYLGEITKRLVSVDWQDRQNVHERVTMVLSFMEENLALSRMLVNHHLDDQFAVKLFSLPKIVDLLADAVAVVTQENEKQAMINFAVFGSYKILQDWLNASERVSPEEEARLILYLAGKVCH